MQPKSTRIESIDTAKAIGIFLVFYGHLVGEFSGLGSQVAFTQLKFIFSFHMPFFFIVAGFFFRRRFQSLRREVKDSFYKRMLPVFLFALIALPLWPLYRYLILGYVDIPIFTELVLPYLKGYPALNQITWFLVCLFTVEIIAIFVLPKIGSHHWGLIIAGLFLGISLFLTQNIKLTEDLFGIYKNTWFVHEALVAFGLYALGYFGFKYINRLMQSNMAVRFLLLIVFLVIVLLTFDLNSPYEEFVVIMKDSFHGDSVWFLISALSGTLAILLFSTFIPRNRIINFVGTNTLILLGINGIFHAFVNIHIITKFQDLESVVTITTVSFVAAVLSILVSVPLILILNRYLPQLVGKPYHDGPWLPPFT